MQRKKIAPERPGTKDFLTNPYRHTEGANEYPLIAGSGSGKSAYIPSKQKHHTAKRTGQKAPSVLIYVRVDQNFTVLGAPVKEEKVATASSK